MFLNSGSSKNQDQNISFNSPYKNVIKNVNFDCAANDSYNEENDFKKSAHNKVKAVSKLRNRSKTVSKRKRQIQKTNLVRNFGVSIRKCDDFDSEHVDIALALSKSLQYTEDDSDEKLSQSSQSEENVLALRTNLKKFGFKTLPLKSSNVKLNGSSRQEHKKQGKFKFVTPTLFLRTEEDRNKIIANRVDAILLEQDTNIQENKHLKTGNLCSQKLCHFYHKESKLFNHTELQNFYVEKLGISPKKEKVGRYLKDWKTIPGRDKSPSPEKTMFHSKDKWHVEKCDLIKAGDILSDDTQKSVNCLSPPVVEDNLFFLSKNNYNTISDNLHLETVKQIKTETQDIRSISPDLFESDEESPSLPKIENNNVETSSTSYENSTKIDFVPRSDIEEQTNSTYLSDSYLEKSFNVTEYVMKILNHDSTCLTKYLNSTQNITMELSEDATNLDDLKNVNAEQPNFYNEHSSKIIDNKSSFNKLLKDRETSNNFLIESLKDEMNSRCNIGSNKDDDEVASINLNNMNISIQNKISFLNRLSNESVIDIDENTVGTRDVTAFNKTKTEGSVYSNKEKDFPPIKNNFSLLNSQENIEISSEDEDSLPIISVRNKMKTNSTSTELSNCKSLGIASENAKNVEERPKTPQCGDNLVQITDDKNVINSSLEKEEKLMEKNILSSQVGGGYLSNFIKDKSQENFEEKERNEGSSSVSVQTPKQQIEIKVDNITPMINYDDLDSPEIHKELDKFGLKPLKRKRGIEFLKYIYESTHPVLHISEDVSGHSAEDEEGVIKKVKENDSSGIYNNDKCIEIVGDLISEKADDIIIERKKSSSKLATCAVPLHIAWFNFISCNPQIKENILLYEPLQLECLHASLQEQGHKYNIEDLLQFLDKKCINIRRNNNHGKGNKW